MHDINLLPIEKAKGKLSFIDNKLKMVFLAAVGVSVIILIISIAFMILTSGYKNDIDNMNKELSKYSSVNKIRNDIKEKTDKYTNLTNFLKAATAINTDMTAVFDKIGSVTPDAVSTIKLSFASFSSITAEGSSKDNDSIAYFIYKLKETGIFSNITIQSIKQDIKTGKYSFNLNLSLKKLNK